MIQAEGKVSRHVCHMTGGDRGLQLGIHQGVAHGEPGEVQVFYTVSLLIIKEVIPSGYD